MLYVGGLRPRHTVGAYEESGHGGGGSGYEFAHGMTTSALSPEMPEATVLYDDAANTNWRNSCRS